MLGAFGLVNLRVSPVSLKRINEILRKSQSADTSKKMFSYIKKMMRSIIERMFNSKGGKFGRDKWPALSPTIMGRIRTGTDGQPHGRYSSSSQLMKASGLYYRSFRTLKENISSSRSTLRWGSNHPMADDLPFGNSSRKDGQTTPRHSMPDPKSADFKRTFDGVRKTAARKIISEIFNA